MKQKAELYDRIIEFTNRKRCDFNSHITRCMIGITMSFAPILSFISATRFITLLVFSIFKELRIEVNPDQVVNICPSHRYFNQNMIVRSVDYFDVEYTQQEIKLCKSLLDHRQVYKRK